MPTLLHAVQAWLEGAAMKGRRWKLVGVVRALLFVALVSYCAYDWLRWRERPDPVTGVALELRPAHQVIKVGQMPDLTLALVNRGDGEVILVEPGDGSDWGWRTPLIEWSNSPWFRGVRCGNINALKPEEVFILKPGESRQLTAWLGAPPLSGPGRYRVAVRYTNLPDQPWSGIPLDEHDVSAWEKMRRSTNLSAVSNTVEIVVED